MSPADQLTTRERDIIRALRAGLTDKEIAYEFKCSVATVSVHIRHARMKVGAKTRSHLMALLISGTRKA